MAAVPDGAAPAPPRTAVQSPRTAMSAGSDPELQYAFDRGRLPPRWAGRALELGPDAALDAYLVEARRRRLGWLGTICHRVLRLYANEYDVNAWLGAYPMHLASRDQWKRLLGGRRGGRLLDVGAGDGSVTRGLAPLFDRVEATELSASMARRLARGGRRCHRRDVATAGLPPGPWDAVALLNVLDRTAKPLSLLRAVAKGLDPRGRLVAALSLPYDPVAYEGPHPVEPLERLPIDAGDWEQEATRFVGRALEPLGFVVTSLARLPYLTGGDWHTPLGVLDDVVVVAERVPDP